MSIPYGLIFSNIESVALILERSLLLSTVVQGMVVEVIDENPSRKGRERAQS